MATEQLNLVEINNLDSLDKWTDSWNEVVAGQPMRSIAWMLGWWEHFQSPDKRLRIGLLTEADRLVGIAPLYESQLGSKTVLRLLGDAGDVCTDHTTWFASPHYANAVGVKVADWLLENKDWSRLHFESIDIADEAMASSLRHFESHGCLLHTQSTESCWSLELPSTWEEYLSSLSKNHRKRCRRWVKNYFDSGRVQVRTAASKEDWNDYWPVFLNLHRERWGSPERTNGCFSNQRFAAFHNQVSQHLIDSNQLRLCYLEVEGKPIASEYQLRDSQTLYCYQSGMSNDHQDIGPGNLSLVATVRYCIDNGLSRLDFLRGDEPYKKHWLAQPNSRNDVRVWRPGIHGQVECGLLKARGIAAAWLRG